MEPFLHDPVPILNPFADYFSLVFIHLYIDSYNIIAFCVQRYYIAPTML